MPKRQPRRRRAQQKVSEPRAQEKAEKPRPKNFTTGCSILPKTHKLGRMMKWPKYIRVQRQEQVLKKRLKVPATIAQFLPPCVAHRGLAQEAFALFKKYSPPSKAERKQTLKAIAAAKAEGKEADIQRKIQVKYGLKHVTNLIQKKQAQAVLIAHDVEPLELIVWMPTLCHKMEVPYAIVKGKAALGKLVGMKTATCCCLTEVNPKDAVHLEALQEKMKRSFNENFAEKKVREAVYGVKTTHRMQRQAKVQ